MLQYIRNIEIHQIFLKIETIEIAYKKFIMIKMKAVYELKTTLFENRMLPNQVFIINNTYANMQLRNGKAEASPVVLLATYCLHTSLPQIG